VKESVDSDALRDAEQDGLAARLDQTLVFFATLELVDSLFDASGRYRSPQPLRLDQLVVVVMRTIQNH
jgi:hypothetical protein